MVALGLLAAAAGTAVAFGALSRAQATPTTVTVGTGTNPIALHGTDGPGFTITFAFSDNNQTIVALNPGTYKLTIDDLSNAHNFHLTGAGIDQTTSVAEVSTTVWTVTLQPGTYNFVCDPHVSTMSGQLLILPYGTMTTFPAPPPQVKKPKPRHKSKS